MTLLNAWYSIRQRDPNFYHDNHLCPAGSAIPSMYRKRGHRCRMLCPTCVKLTAADQMAKHFALLESP